MNYHLLCGNELRGRNGLLPHGLGEGLEGSFRLYVLISPTPNTEGNIQRKMDVR